MSPRRMHEMDKDALEREYCPPLDPALFEAILSDFDIGISSGLADARATLDQLKETATVEQFADFEPSGVGKFDTTTDNERSQTSNGVTDDTSISQDFAELGLNDELSNDLENIDDDTKMSLLIDAFTDFFGDNILRRALDDNHGHLQKTFDDLLTQRYLLEEHTEEATPKKGVDGFAEPLTHSKKKKKGKNARSSVNSPVSDYCDSPVDSPTNRWQRSQEEIDFLCSRTGNNGIIVQPLYHKHGGSLPKTLAVLLDQEIAKHGNTKDSSLTLDVAEQLGDQFHGISYIHLLSIVRITAPSTFKARELARAYTRQPEEVVTKLIPQYIRPNESDLNGASWNAMSNKKAKPEQLSMPRNSAAYDEALNHLFSQARAMHRKGKSNGLYGAASAYYAEEGRETVRFRKAAIASEADVFAAGQSTASQVDLHGLDTVNAVRIAREKTEQWWAGLGESRINGRVGAGRRQESFRIVVGRGTHSAGGRGVLGPAVSKMLREEGWKFVSEGAVLAVSGK